MVRQDTQAFFFNDLDIDQKGNLYISDTEGSRIFFASSDASDPQIFYSENEMYPNGITLDEYDRSLYIASWQKGILRLDLDSMTTSSIHPEEAIVSSQGIDGLYFYNKSLVGIQNGYQDKSKHKILRFYLDDNHLVYKIDTLLTGHSSFDVPTTGVVVNDRFYCLANSQMDNLDQKTNEIIDTNILNPTLILGISLQ